MGGYGSTRWNWKHTRTDTAGLLRLDVRWLARRGCLRPGTVCTLTWTGGDEEPAGTIATIMRREQRCLAFIYSTRRHGEPDWTPRTERVWLDMTACHYGGERWWFLCPHCHTRCAVLFGAGGLFACRTCHDLAYTSTREDDAARCDRRIHRLAEQLGSDGNGRRGFLWTMPDKPAGMHWTTYERLTRDLVLAHRLRDDLLAEGFARIVARSETLLQARE